MTIDIQRRTLLGAGAATLLGVAVGSAPLAAAPRVIAVVAKKFEFVPAEIRVRRGETVTLSITAPEVPMGFNLADFKLRADVMPGRVSTLTLTAEQPGSYTFVCDVFCGSGHEDMSGTLVVV